jgi:hypothetical protein
MNLEPVPPATKNPAAQFARDVRLDPIAPPPESHPGQVDSLRNQGRQ